MQGTSHKQPDIQPVSEESQHPKTAFCLGILLLTMTLCGMECSFGQLRSAVSAVSNPNFFPTGLLAQREREREWS